MVGAVSGPEGRDVYRTTPKNDHFAPAEQNIPFIVNNTSRSYGALAMFFEDSAINIKPLCGQANFSANLETQH